MATTYSFSQSCISLILFQTPEICLRRAKTKRKEELVNLGEVYATVPCTIILILTKALYLNIKLMKNIDLKSFSCSNK